MYVLLVGIVFLFVGLIFLWLSLSHELKNKKLLLKCSSTISAKFDSIQEMYFINSNTKKSYFPIYKYSINNKEYCYRGFGQSNKDIIDKKDIIINYNPNNPEENYEMQNVLKLQKNLKLFKLLGILFLLISIILFIILIYKTL